MMKHLLSLITLCGTFFLPLMQAETKTAHDESAQGKKTIQKIVLTNKHALPITLRMTHNTMGATVDAWTSNRTTITGNDKDRHVVLQPGFTITLPGPFIFPNSSPIRITWKNPADNKEQYQEITFAAQEKNQRPVERILQADGTIQADFYFIPENNFSVDSEVGTLELIFKNAPSKLEKTP